MTIDRRKFLANVVGACGAVAAGSMAGLDSAKLFAGAAGEPSQQVSSAELLSPAQSGIEHIVVVTMENRSFDHFFGWMSWANGKQSGLQYKDPGGTFHPTHRLAPDFTGCPQADPDHSYKGARVEYNHGLMDGFLLDTANDEFSIGYYTAADIPFYAALAKNYTTLSHYFPSILGPTFPNRLFIHAAQTDRLDDSVSLTSLPTIWDKLDAAGISHKYYFNNVSFLALWGLKYIFISDSYSNFLSDAANGTLPAVSFVDPIYTVLDDGTGDDDHPHADIRYGDHFLSQTFRAVAHGPAWKNTVFVVNFDEWGGFFEHVPPPRAAAPNSVDPDLVNGKALLGFRVPTVIASPFTAGNPSNPRVVGTRFDHTSILKLIEWRWGLSPLTARDASTDVGNIVTTLNLTKPQTQVPALPNPAKPQTSPCFGLLPGAAASAQSRTSMGRLAQSDLMRGWKR
jgi:phospholipase C